MRDPARIEPMLDMLRKAWERNPDWRLGQLVFNAIRQQRNATEMWQLFNAEDDVAMAGLCHFAGEFDQ